MKFSSRQSAFSATLVREKHGFSVLKGLMSLLLALFFWSNFAPVHAGTLDQNAIDAEIKAAQARMTPGLHANAVSPPPPYFGTNPTNTEIKAKLIAAGTKYHIPPHILFGIAYQESGWAQFRSDGRTVYHLEPDGRVGVGMMQMTVSPSQSDYARLCTDIDYNIDQGASLLVGKWNATPSIGDGTGLIGREKLENWFYSIWAYNGFICPNPNNYAPNVLAHIANGRSRWTGVPVTAPTVTCPLKRILVTPSPVHIDADFDGIIDDAPRAPTLTAPLAETVLPTGTQPLLEAHRNAAGPIPDSYKFYVYAQDGTTLLGSTLVTASGDGAVRQTNLGTTLRTDYWWTATSFSKGIESDPAPKLHFYIATVAKLVQASGESTVFLITADGKRRAFDSTECMNDWGYTASAVQVVPRSVVDSYPWDEPIPHLVRATGDPQVYYIEPESQAGTGKLLRPVQDLSFMHFRATDVQALQPSRFSDYAAGTSVNANEVRLCALSAPVFTPLPVYAGRPFTFKITVRNLGALTQADSFQFVLAGPNGQSITLPVTGAITLDNGQDTIYSTQATLTDVGHYSLAQSSFEAKGVWYSMVDSGRDPQSTGIDVLPFTPPASLSLDPSTVTAGGASTGTLTLTAAAPAGGETINLACDSTNATVPSTVTIPEGVNSATFSITTLDASPLSNANISASLADVVQTARLSIVPKIQLLSVTLDPSDVPGGQASTGTVTLDNPAPAGGATVALLSSATDAATVPDSVVVPEGATSVQFQISTTAKTTSSTATITASLSGVVQSATLTVSGSLPSVTITNPESDNVVVTSLASATGTATAGGGSTLTGVTGSLYRFSSGPTSAGYWDGIGSWTTTSNELPTTGSTDWSLALPTLPDGQYSLTATANDSSGASASAGPRPFWIEATKPVLSIDDVKVTEGVALTPNAVFTVTLSKASGHTVTVNLKTIAGLTNPATAGLDYTALPSTQLTFAPGQTSQMVSVPILDDVLSEADETFQVQLSDATNATIGKSLGVGTIIDNDAAPKLSINDVTMTEGNSGSKSMVFTVTLSAASGREVKVNYATANGTAVAPGDYTAASGTLTFAAGQTAKTLSVAIKGDILDESNETFQVKLSTPVNATIADSSGLGTITDDDAAPTLTVDSPSIVEGNSGQKTLNFTLKLSKASGQTIILSCKTGDASIDSATAGTDYMALPATKVTFAPGVLTKTVSVLVKGDILNEANEHFTLLTSGTTTVVIPKAAATATATIVDDDAMPSLKISDASMTEGNSGSKTMNFTVNLSAASGRIVKVNFRTADLTALASFDYQGEAATVTFAPGEIHKTISILVYGDTVHEANEQFQVLLDRNVNATIDDALAIGTIIDDDKAVVAPTAILKPSAPSS